MLVCKKAYVQDLDAACVLDARIHGSYGAKGNWHRAYIGIVVEAYQQKR